MHLAHFVVTRVPTSEVCVTRMVTALVFQEYLVLYRARLREQVRTFLEKFKPAVTELRTPLTWSIFGPPEMLQADPRMRVAVNCFTRM